MVEVVGIWCSYIYNDILFLFYGSGGGGGGGLFIFLYLQTSQIIKNITDP